MPAGQLAYDGGVFLADRAGDRLHVHVEHSCPGLPLQFSGEQDKARRSCLAV